MSKDYYVTLERPIFTPDGRHSRFSCKWYNDYDESTQFCEVSIPKTEQVIVPDGVIRSIVVCEPFGEGES